MNPRSFIPVLTATLLVCTACAGMGRSIPRLPADPEKAGYIMIGKGLQLPRGRLPLYCGPESLAAVFKHHGKPVDIEVIGRDIYNPDQKGTPSTEMVRYAASRGFNVTTPRGSIGRIKNNIDAGVLPIINIHISGSVYHYFVVIGYNDRERVIVCLEYEGYLRLLGYDELVMHWEPTNFDMILIHEGTAHDAFEIGRNLESADKHQEAIEHYRKAIALDKDHTDARVSLGWCLEQLGKLKEAKGVYEETLRMSPSHSRVMNNLANLLIDLGEDTKKAETLAGQSVAGFRGALERTKRDLATAEGERLRKQLRREKFEGEIYLAFSLDTLAKARMANDKHKLAAAAWQASLDLLPLTMPDTRAKRMLNLYRANRKMGMTAVARTWLDKARAEAKDKQLRAEIEAEGH